MSDELKLKFEIISNVKDSTEGVDAKYALPVSKYDLPCAVVKILKVVYCFKIRQGTLLPGEVNKISLQLKG